MDGLRPVLEVLGSFGHEERGPLNRGVDVRSLRPLSLLLVYASSQPHLLPRITSYQFKSECLQVPNSRM